MINNQKIILKFIQTNNTNVDWYRISYKYILSENFKIKLIGIVYHQIKLYQNLLL